MKAYLKTTFILLLTLAFACKEKPLEFIKLDQFSKIDTMQDNGREYYYKTDCYIVYNYQDNLNNEKAVDSFAYKNRTRDLSKYLNYQIVIYKSSDVTSIENLKANPKDFEVQSLQNDMIYRYKWSDGEWVGKSKFKNYELVEAQEMIRED